MPKNGYYLLYFKTAKVIIFFKVNKTNFTTVKS